MSLWLFASVIIDDSFKPPQSHDGCFNKLVLPYICMSEGRKRCESPQHSRSFPLGSIEGSPYRQMAICMTSCVSFLWCYHFLVHTLANTFIKIKSQYNRGNSAGFYNKHLKGCFTQCCTLFSWFEPRLDLLRLSNSNWLVKIIVSSDAKLKILLVFCLVSVLPPHHFFLTYGSIYYLIFSLCVCPNFPSLHFYLLLCKSVSFLNGILLK